MSVFIRRRFPRHETSQALDNRQGERELQCTDLRDDILPCIRHALRNALLPVLTIVGLQFGAMLSGTVVTETVFSRPGLGRLVVSAILWQDYPLVQGIVLFMATIYVVVNLLVDISYAWLDPRIRYGIGP